MKKELLYLFFNLIVANMPLYPLRRFLYKRFGVSIGEGAVIYQGLEIRKPSGVVIGEDSSIGHRCTLDGRCGITIGKHVNMSSEVMVWTLQHDMNSSSFAATGGAVEIGDYAWISARAIILPGRRIGKGAVVAAGAVVTKDVNDYSIVGGVPARVLGRRSIDLDYTVCESVPTFM